MLAKRPQWSMMPAAWSREVAWINPRNALALYARGLTLLKKGDTEVGKNDISAAKAINPNIAEQFDHSESPSR
jgi:hypothetical protein